MVNVGDSSNGDIKRKMEEMRNTEGWKVFQGELKSRYTSAVKNLVTGKDTSVEAITTQRARCRLIRELLGVAGISEEEL